MEYILDGKKFNNQRDYRKALKELEDRNNAYDLWSEEEDSELEKLSEILTISGLAEHFKRTESAIISRLPKVSSNYEIRTELHSNGLMKEKALYKKHWLLYQIKWHENGQKASEGEGDEGDEVGNWTQWHENGQKKSQGNYESCNDYDDGLAPVSIKVGKWSSWHDNGQIKSEGSFYNCWKDDDLVDEGIKGCYPGDLKVGADIQIDFYPDEDDFDDDFRFAKKGNWTEWYENGQIKSKGRYKDLVYDGKWTFWHENGQKSSEGIYKDSYKYGKHTTWHETGYKKSEYFHKEMPKNKDKMQYSSFEEDRYYSIGTDDPEDGDYSMSVGIYYYQDNKYYHGKCSEWDEDGQITIDLNYKDGQMWDGNWSGTESRSDWGEEGVWKSAGHYKNGEREDKWTLWKISESVYDDNVLKPYWDDFEDIFKIEKCYKNGKENGKRISWYKNGKKESEGIIKEDKWFKERGDREYQMHGKWICWHKNGQKASQGNYKNGIEDGNWSVWHKNGKKSFESLFKEGKKEGHWTSWNKIGRILKKGEFKKDKLVSGEDPYEIDF